MARSEAQRERSTYRKTASMLEQTHGGYQGKSIRQQLIERLDAAMGKYLDAPHKSDERCMARGEVRGLAWAVGLMSVEAYTPVSAMKKAEKDSASRVRRQRAQEQAAQAGD